MSTKYAVCLIAWAVLFVVVLCLRIWFVHRFGF